MKKSIQLLVTVIVITISTTTLKAQKSGNSGIYMSEADFKTGKLGYILGDHDRLRLNAFFGGNNVKVNYQGKHIKLAKRSMFGYRLNNQDFRFVNNTAYKILDTAGFMLYSCPKLVLKGKGSVAVEQYFYSISPNQSIRNLTIENIADSFNALTAFRYQVRNMFKSDADLILYDQHRKQYEIKYLYLENRQVLAAHKN